MQRHLLAFRLSPWMSACERPVSCQFHKTSKRLSFISTPVLPSSPNRVFRNLLPARGHVEQPFGSTGRRVLVCFRPSHGTKIRTRLLALCQTESVTARTPYSLLIP